MYQESLYTFAWGDSLAKHDFGIIDSFKENKWYSDYEPEKYNCISFPDDYNEESNIYLKDILSEKEGVKFSLILMK